MMSCKNFLVMPLHRYYKNLLIAYALSTGQLRVSFARLEGKITAIIEVRHLYLGNDPRCVRPFGIEGRTNLGGRFLMRGI